MPICHHHVAKAQLGHRLLAVLALTDLETPIICNGFKDDEFIKMTMLARKIGKQIIPVVEKSTELETIVRHAQELNVRPVIGFRAKLVTRGAGRRKAVTLSATGSLWRRCTSGGGPTPPISA